MSEINNKTKNPIYYSNGILLKVALTGTLEGCVSQRGNKSEKKPFPSEHCPRDPKTGDYQKDDKGHYVSAVWLSVQEHTDRKVLPCYQTTTIQPWVIQGWADTIPSWINTKTKPGRKALEAWKALSLDERIQLYLDKFDRGLGISYQLL